jgi:hypothetical protein
MPLRVVVIVEGHGEDGAIRTLIERIWYELLAGDYIEVIPWRGKQGQLRKKRASPLWLKQRQSNSTLLSGRTYVDSSWF